MAAYRAPVGDEGSFREALLDAGLLVDLGVPGVYGRGATFEGICEAVDTLITRTGVGDEPEQLRFPPLLPRRVMEDVGYLSSFPHLAGTIFGFEGDENAAREMSERAAAHEDWSAFQSMTDLVLTPAACYPVYPSIAQRAPLRPGGITVDAGSAFVFRSEPAGDPARLQMFRQRELVRIGEPEAVLEWRETWRTRAVELLRRLGLEAGMDIANDPFFGRAGRMLAANQRAQELKYEVTIPIASPTNTAVASFNYHQDHFGQVFDLRMTEGGPVHTACLGFGVERITMGLLRAHGLDRSAWRGDVTRELWP